MADYVHSGRAEPEMLSESDSRATPAERPLGVLFVHGIGDQKRGDTLPWAGDPLCNWLSRWASQDQDTPQSQAAKPRLSNTRLTRPVPSEQDAPPYTAVYFPSSFPGRTAGKEWILAESWWATEFLPPTYSEALPLALTIFPWFIEQTGKRIIDDILLTIRARREKIKGGSSTPAGDSRPQVPGLAPIIGDLSWRAAQVTATILGSVLVLLLGVLAQLAIITLLVLGLVPPLRSTVTSLQLKLAGWLGDAYVMAISPIRFDAMVSQVRRDIKWLASQDDNMGRCKRIAVVAHSGGAPVVHAAVTGPDAVELDENVLLVTYGSGHSKVDYIREASSPKAEFYRLSPYFRLAVVGLVVLSFVLGVQVTPPQPWTFIALAGALVGSILIVVASRVAAAGLGQFRPGVPKGGEWIDYRSLADIVPDTPIVSRDNKNRTEEVNNLHSVAQDHGWYWHNDEEFVAEMARLLHAKATGQDLATSGAQKMRLSDAQSRRKDRVLRYLNAGLLLIVSMPVLLLDLGPAVAASIGEPIRKFLLENLTGTIISPAEITRHAPTIFWANLLGAVIIAIALIAWNKVALLSLWKQWAKKEEATMFQAGMRKAESRRSAVWFILASALVPVVVSIVALVQTFFLNVGFPQGVQGVQSLLATIASLITGSQSVAEGIAASSGLNLALRVVLLIYAAAIAGTSVINAAATWRFHSTEDGAEQRRYFTGGRPVFSTLLASLSSTPPSSLQAEETTQGAGTIADAGDQMARLGGVNQPAPSGGV